MQTTSALWKALWAAGARLEARATIAGTVYTDVGAPVITRAAMRDGLGVGNVVSACCVLAVRTTDAIPRSAEVRVEMRLTDGESVSEWLPAGTFYISRRSRDPLSGVVTLECYDALLKAGAALDVVPWTTGDGEVITTGDGEPICVSAPYPRSMDALLEDVAWLLGVEIDPRTELATGADYTVEQPLGSATVRDLLAKIGAANGGSWIMTPENKLRLVPVIDPEDGEADAVDIEAVVGGADAGDAAQISGVRNTAEDGQATLIGDDSGAIVDVELSEALAADLAERLIGVGYQPYALRGAIYDPAAEIGDIVSWNGISGVLWAETATLGAAFRGDISAPDPAELADEYPYPGASGKALSEAKAYTAKVVENALGELDESLDQQEIFGRLTNNGETQGIYMQDGKIYINGTYIQAGTIIANLIKGGILKLGGAANENGLLQVLNANGDVVVTLDDSGANISEGNIVSYTEGKTRRVSLDAGELHYEGYLASTSDSNLDWRTLLKIEPHTLSQYVENCMTQLYSDGSLYLGAGYQKSIFLSIVAEQTQSAVKLYQVVVAADGIHIGGPLHVSDGTNNGTGQSGTFTTADGKTVTLLNGIATDVSSATPAVQPVNVLTGVGVVRGGYIKIGRTVTFTVNVTMGSPSATDLLSALYGFPAPLYRCGFEIESDTSSSVSLFRRAKINTSGVMALIGAFDTDETITISGSYISAS